MEAKELETTQTPNQEWHFDKTIDAIHAKLAR